MVDLAPTLSPVRWVQQVGRVTRPWDRTPQVVCTNRNVMRHAYAMQGVVPISAVADSERAFPPTERAHVRALGLEAIGRFKPTGVKLSSGATVHMYSLTAPIKSENGQATVYVQYACLVHPTQEPAWFSKVNMQQGETRTWGTWAPCEPPQDLRGFASAPPSELSPKQRAWWERSAGSFGLAEQEVDRKKFSILPIMADAGVRFW